MARRAAQVKLAAREPRLVAFARSVADVALADDAWAERIGSFVIARPPSQWSPTDDMRARGETDLLGGAFCRMEATAFGHGSEIPAPNALRTASAPAHSHATARTLRAGATHE